MYPQLIAQLNLYTLGFLFVNIQVQKTQQGNLLMYPQTSLLASLKATLVANPGHLELETDLSNEQLELNKICVTTKTFANLGKITHSIVKVCYKFTAGTTTLSPNAKQYVWFRSRPQKLKEDGCVLFFFQFLSVLLYCFYYVMIVGPFWLFLVLVGFCWLFLGYFGTLWVVIVLFGIC